MSAVIPRWRRVWLFARQYVSEFPLVWSIVRNSDCERAGGHFWGEPEVETTWAGGRMVRTCSKCGTSELMADDSKLPLKGERISVKYHCEDGHWWSEVTTEGYNITATDITLGQLRERTRDLLGFFADDRLRARSVGYMKIDANQVIRAAATENFILYDPNEQVTNAA